LTNSHTVFGAGGLYVFFHHNDINGPSHSLTKIAFEVLIESESGMPSLKGLNGTLHLDVIWGMLPNVAHDSQRPSKAL
jgi:hypothetical protein